MGTADAMKPDAARKRAFDLAVALPCFVLALPVIAVAMVAIRMTSPGPAIFSQLRVGRHEQPFRCHKLRSMHHLTPEVPTHEAAAGAVTRIGAFLRRFKIDELPQLWNVIAGEMSMVGPRPCLPTQAELIGWRRELGVFDMRPGITGLAQVRGIDMSDPALCARADAEYGAGISLRGDAALLAHTFARR